MAGIATFVVGGFLVVDARWFGLAVEGFRRGLIDDACSDDCVLAWNALAVA